MTTENLGDRPLSPEQILARADRAAGGAVVSAPMAGPPPADSVLVPPLVIPGHTFSPTPVAARLAQHLLSR